jgi:hypothetical protein
MPLGSVDTMTSSKLKRSRTSRTARTGSVGPTSPSAAPPAAWIWAIILARRWADRCSASSRASAISSSGGSGGSIAKPASATAQICVSYCGAIIGTTM